MNEHFEQFRRAIAEAGMTPPDAIHDDGQIHRFSTNGKPRDEAGWYVYHSDGIPAGAFGDWREGFSQNWCSKPDNVMTEAERQAHRACMQAMQQQREEDSAERHRLAAEQARQRWDAAQPCTQHDYLSRKGIKAAGLKVEEDNLLIPMWDASTVLSSLQLISPDGSKRFMPQGKVKGCYCCLGSPADKLIVCEGYATGASIHEATGLAVAVAFSAGNLEAVATALHAKYPAIQIILAADDDWKTSGNPGIASATAAAQAVSGLLAVPVFPEDRQEKSTDFNDLHQMCGISAVKACIDAAKAPIADKDSGPSQSNEWPELTPLVAQLEPLKYPLDALPLTVRLAVDEVVSFVKAPIPLAAMSAISALSLAIQAHYDVERATKLQGPTSLFMLAIAESGERKSTVDKYFTAPIRAFEADQQHEFKQKSAAHKSDLEIWQTQLDQLRDKIKTATEDGLPVANIQQEMSSHHQNKPPPIRTPKLIFGDATPEALTFSLAKQWPSGGIFSSEAGAVFGGPGMSKDSVMRNLAALNQFWDGGTFSVERKTTDSFTVRGARLSMSLQVQEGPLQAFFNNTSGLARGTGFLARFLISYPQSTQGTRAFTEAPQSWPELRVFEQRLMAILSLDVPMDDDGALQPKVLALDPLAKVAWVAFHDEVEAKLGTGGDLADVRDVASKAADNAARLAALFHVFEGGSGPIDKASMDSAIQVMWWHLLEARRFLGRLSVPPELAEPARLEAWLIDYCSRAGSDVVPIRDIQQRGPSGLRAKAPLESALKTLVSLHHVREVTEGKSRYVRLNPALLLNTASPRS